MVRDVKYIYCKMTYNELKRVLLDSKHLSRFPLVDNPESMVLLGSIQRMQLIKLIQRHVGRERRLQVKSLAQFACITQASHNIHETSTGYAVGTSIGFQD